MPAAGKSSGQDTKDVSDRPNGGTVLSFHRGRGFDGCGADNSFDRFSGQQFTVEPQTQPVGNSEQIVRTRVTPPSDDSRELDYLMRNTASGWRAVDVLADGTIRRVAVQCSDFRRLLARGGAPALAASLTARSRDLSDGMS